MKRSQVQEIKYGYKAGLAEGRLQGKEEAADLALDQIDKGGPGTKATRIAWNMACVRIAQEIRKNAKTEENNPNSCKS